MKSKGLIEFWQGVCSIRSTSISKLNNLLIGAYSQYCLACTWFGTWSNKICLQINALVWTCRLTALLLWHSDTLYIHCRHIHAVHYITTVPSLVSPVPPGAYFFCSARMNLVRVMQLVSMVSLLAMLMRSVMLVTTRQWRNWHTMSAESTGSLQNRFLWFLFTSCGAPPPPCPAWLQWLRTLAGAWHSTACYCPWGCTI